MAAGQEINGVIAASACTMATYGDDPGDDMNGWDVSKTTDMSAMLEGASVFNLPLNSWNVAKVTDISNMFQDAVKFNQPLNSWNTAKVTDMSGTFQKTAGTSAFSAQIESWNTARVTTMKNMFSGADVFKQNLNDWKVG